MNILYSVIFSRDAFMPFLFIFIVFLLENNISRSPLAVVHHMFFVHSLKMSAAPFHIVISHPALFLTYPISIWSFSSSSGETIMRCYLMLPTIIPLPCPLINWQPQEYCKDSVMHSHMHPQVYNYIGFFLFYSLLSWLSSPISPHTVYNQVAICPCLQRSLQ